MAEKSVAERIQLAKERVERAQAKCDRAWARVWDLLGWGEGIKLDAARRANILANKELNAAISALQKLEQKENTPDE